MTDRIIIGVTGASGVALGVSALRLARAAGLETHLVLTKAAELTLGYETALHPRDVRAMADVDYAIGDVGASIASGSFETRGMLIAPCSMKSLGEIAHGVGATLLARAADVCLKERRRLVLMPRETPLHAGHLRAMLTVTEIGAVVMPPTPAWYAETQTLDEATDQLAARALSLFGVAAPGLKRWGEELEKGRRRGGRGADSD
ncbi:MAG: UbiX family flavin prenyltransferase [Pseudomonadota bacterium]